MMNSAFKQRLVGAAVLVALAVIFLPMLLDRPAPPAGSESVTLDLPPAPGQSLETRELPLTPPTLAPGASGAGPADPNLVTTVDVTSSRPADAVATAPVSASSSGAPSVASPAPMAATSPPAATPASPPAAGMAAPAANTASISVGAQGGRFAVNLGTFANAANASALQARLQKAGVPVYAEPAQLDGKPVQRLRAGPFATRADAEQMRMTVRRVDAGLAASVVALEDAPPATATVKSGFAVQVGAFKNEADARVLRGRLHAGGFTAFTDQVRTDAGVLYRVRVGPELERSRAEQAQTALKQKYQLEGVIVAHP